MTTTKTYTIEDNGWSVAGCPIIYAPRGQAGEYAKLATNPYRGCGHKCAYCLSGDTLIQMSDGSTKFLQDIAVGDAIVGVTINGNARAWNTRLANTTVMAKIISHKAAYRVALADGTRVVCSADHRWLTERGWKYTAPADDGKQRPTLTTNNSIRKISKATATPAETPAYQTGYVAGMVEGDATMGVYDYSHKRRPSGKMMGVQHTFRLALKDKDALTRTKSYLAAQGIETRDFAFACDTCEMNAIGTTSPTRVAAIKALTQPQGEGEWQRGWLAGAFDAEGSHGKEALRIANNDESFLRQTEHALSTFGFDSVRDTGHCTYVRIRGGRAEEMRFWQLVNPAIKRKFSLDGQAVCDSTRVVSVEPLGKTIEMFDIMTGTETFIANGLVSHNCYVPSVLRITREEFDADATPRDNWMGVLLKDARKYQACGITEQVMLSFTTDPFNPNDMSLTRPTLETLAAHRMAFCTLTKGGARALPYIDMFRPDRDAFASTLTSLDDAFSMKWERGAALPGDRIATLKAFHDAGIFTWVSLEPTLNTEASLALIERTHEFVDLFKIGRANYLPMTYTTDWEEYTHRIVELVNRLGVRHYIKKDLQPFLPACYYNPRYIPQNNANGVGNAGRDEMLHEDAHQLELV